jgi:hypothetical protein
VAGHRHVSVAEGAEGIGVGLVELGAMAELGVEVLVEDGVEEVLRRGVALALQAMSAGGVGPGLHRVDDEAIPDPDPGHGACRGDTGQLPVPAEPILELGLDGLQRAYDPLGGISQLLSDLRAIPFQVDRLEG